MTPAIAHSLFKAKRQRAEELGRRPKSLYCNSLRLPAKAGAATFAAMPIAKTLGEALKLLRTRRGWAQKQLAAAAGITKGMVSSYEKAKQRPTLVTLTKMLNALEADLCDLYWAIEFVDGTQRPVHDLSERFRLGHAGPARPTAQRPSGASVASVAEGRPGGEMATEPPLPDYLETALHRATEGFHQIARCYLLLMLLKQPR
jgi:transcriptional regulator with XRE-family HTH domain